MLSPACMLLYGYFFTTITTLYNGTIDMIFP
uniref:Uncharacterized protein n=1 Tax=Arundo donax TaxID=35708 RepID=A0A0A8ZVT3_ARUDO